MIAIMAPERSNFFYEDGNNDDFDEDMVLQDLNPVWEPTTAIALPSGKSQVVLALSIVLVILVIFLIISIFLLLYCLLKRQEGKSGRRNRKAYERRRTIRSKKIVTDSERRAKVNQIAASIEAAVKSSQTSQLSKSPQKSLPSPTPPPPPPPKQKPASLKLTPPPGASETAVEAPTVYINEIYVSRRQGAWQQVEREPSDFSYELQSDSVNDDLCMHPF